MTKTMQDKSATIVRKGTVPLTSTKNIQNPAEQENLEVHHVNQVLEDITWLRLSKKWLDLTTQVVG